MRLASPSVLVSVALVAGIACDRERSAQPSSPPPPTAKPPPAAPAEPPASAGDVATKPPPAPDAGALPLDFPAATLEAKPGEFVLAPTQNAVEEAFEVGADRQTFIFYGARVESTGHAASRLKTLPGLEITVPNVLVMPVGPAVQAKPGDVVLTAWASGSGLQRAIVVEGGAPAKPKVRYLDMSLDNPSGWGNKDDELPEGTFRILSKPGEPGSTLACVDGSRTLRWIVVRRAGTCALGLGFAGRLKVLELSTCRELPVVPAVKVGDDVQIPVVGGFTDAKVVSLDAKLGRVVAKYRFGGNDKQESVGFTNVLPAKK